jgi:uncharacterized membrane protein HdeD (DUF308 family)
MDWKLLLIGALMTIIGGFLVFRFRGTNYRKDTGAGCLMTFAILLVITGVLTLGLSFLFRP